MGTPDYILYLDASIEARKKRWLVRNELEEWTEALDEETAAYPDNSWMLFDFIRSKHGDVSSDRFRVIQINSSQT
jgi:hypothetical protein